MSIPEKIWRQYDIRGVIPDDIDVETARLVGRAFGSALRDQGGQSITVAQDCRVTSPELAAATIEGILASGCDALDIGMVPTPLMYFWVTHRKKDAGVVISASHNPPQYNGFKFRMGDLAFFGEHIKGLAGRIARNEFTAGAGTCERLDVQPDYIAHVTERVHFERKLKIAVDAGNGSTGPLALRLFEALGAEVLPLFCEPDGNFPNHQPDPSVPENLRDLIAAVTGEGADLGVAFDGDGDRVAVVTPGGEILSGDRMLAFLCRNMKLPAGAPVIFDVKCSLALIETIEAMGCEPVMTKTGYPYLQEKMLETKAQLGGEMSGHMYVADNYYGFDDGLYAACRIAESISRSADRFDEFFASYPGYSSTPELRLHCEDAVKFEAIKVLVDTLSERYETIDIDGVRFTTPDGWGLFRVSNTEPAIVSRFEARSDAALRRICAEASELLAGTPIDAGPLEEFCS